MILASTWSLKENGLCDRLGDKRTGSYIKVLEHVIMLEEVFKTHPGKSPRPLLSTEIPALTLYTEMMLSLITDAMVRAEGDGFNLIKFHLIMHMVRDDIPKYGLPRNGSGCPGESQFKKNFKLPGEKTQKRAETFDEQCLTRHHENMTISTCQQIIDRCDNEKMVQEASIVLSDHFGHVLSLHSNYKPSQLGNVLSENMYTVLQTRLSTSPDSEPYKVDIVFRGKTKSARSACFPCSFGSNEYLVDRYGMAAGARYILGLRDENPYFSAITDFLTPLVEADHDLRIDIFTSLKVSKTKYQENDVLYRADPFSVIGRKPRHDWSLIQWNESSEDTDTPTENCTQVPGQILAFLDIDDDLMRAFNKSSDHAVYHTGKYALVYSMKKEIPGLMDPTVTELDPGDLMQSNSVLFFWGERETDIEDNLIIRLVDVECFVRPIIVIPDFDPTFKATGKGINVEEWVRSDSRKNAFIVLKPRDLWHSTFLELAKAYYKRNRRAIAKTN